MSVDISDSLATEIAEHCASSGVVNVGEVTIAPRGFARAVYDMDTEEGRRGLDSDVEEIEAEGDKAMVRYYTMSRYEWDDLDEFEGW